MSAEASEAQAIDRTLEAQIDVLNRGDGTDGRPRLPDDAVQLQR